MTHGAERGPGVPVIDSTVPFNYNSKSFEMMATRTTLDIKRLTRIMKALSNENRYALYLGIAEDPESGFETPRCSVSNIVKRFKLSAPTISHHLKELANADLITTERRGKFLVARINKQTVGDLIQSLTSVKEA